MLYRYNNKIILLRIRKNTNNCFILFLFVFVFSTFPFLATAESVKIANMHDFNSKGWVEEVLDLPANKELELGNYIIRYNHVLPQNGTNPIEQITITEKRIDNNDFEKLYQIKSFSGTEEIQELTNKTILLDEAAIAINIDKKENDKLKLTIFSKIKDLFSEINVSTTAPEYILLYQDETVNIPIKINNTGIIDEIIYLNATESEFYKHKFTDGIYRINKMKLDSEEAKEINLELEIDKDCTPGEYVFAINASGRSSSLLSIPFSVEENTNKTKEDLAIQLSKLYVSGKSGSEVTIPVRVINSGNTDLRDIKLDIEPPTDSWKVDVSKKKVDFLKSKEYETVDLTVHIPSEAENGDFFVDIKGSVDGTETEETKLRVNVKPQSSSAWIGLLIIISVIACLFVIYKKYGRR